MGRSVSTAAGPKGAVPITAPDGAAFDATGYHYTVERRGDRLVHREERLDGSEVVASVEAAVAYALGSGERGYSFLVERDGFVPSPRSPGMLNSGATTSLPAMTTGISTSSG